MRIAIFTLLIMALVSCSKEDEAEPIVAMQQVIVLFSPGGVGDMAYNDQILRGVQRVRKDKDFRLLISSPSSVDEAEKIFVDWLKKDAGETKSLFVLAGNEYEQMAVKHLSSGNYTGKEVLLFETRTKDIPQAYTFSITMYGACYLVGGVATIFTDRAAVLCANSNDHTVNEGGVGFVKGFTESGGAQAPLFYLSDTWQGYAMPEAAYKKTAELAPQYRYIFPIAGGSNMGVYRYAREYPYGFYTSGMDIDQSQLSTQITSSVVKHIDRLIVDYLTQWLLGEPLPKNRVYGMQSGYIEVVLSSLCREACQSKFDELRSTAIKREEEHEKEYN
ncbi:BMP family ABC transporter substrate-binding protein [Bacteroides sp.]|uniref:BMP family ABC transporter substrate-binding protein n=1 Tax=Bacteroides sp. TaxID=29523 RepID=UPI002FCA71C2